MGKPRQYIRAVRLTKDDSDCELGSAELDCQHQAAPGIDQSDICCWSGTHTKACSTSDDSSLGGYFRCNGSASFGRVKWVYVIHDTLTCIDMNEELDSWSVFDFQGATVCPRLQRSPDSDIN